jgi:hypothetical protein
LWAKSKCGETGTNETAARQCGKSGLTGPDWKPVTSKFPNIPLHALAQYHYAYTCIVVCGLHHPIEFECIATYWSSLKYLQLLLSPVAAYSLFWHRSLSTFFSYPTSRFQASSSPKKTARLLWHVIMSLGPLFWAACPALGLSRQREDTSRSAAASTSIFPKWPYPLQ